MTPAARYERILERLGAPVLRESSGTRRSELEVQAQLAAGEFGVSWQGEEGETVEVGHFGSWNREPGPDFCRAKVRINGIEQTGAIEIDPDVRDWEHHGHARNPAYNEVILHLFLRRGPQRFFTRTLENRAVVQVCLAQAAAIRRRAPQAPVSGLDAEPAAALIRAAAEFRLRQKADRFRRSSLLNGPDDALFQSIAVGLGYKNNKIPFLLVAQRAGLRRAAGRGGEALLFGLAGFLRADDFASADPEARAYLRRLWEEWWAVRDSEVRLVLGEDAWKMAALRPANHPHRRMGALAAVASSFRRIAQTASPDAFLRILGALEHPFWNSHTTLRCDRLPRPAALIGAERARDLLINAFLPTLPFETAWAHLEKLPGPNPSAKVTKACAWVCTGAPAPFLRSALHQQGLLQLHDDFFPRAPGEIWNEFATGTANPDPS